MGRIVRALTRNVAETSPGADDPRLLSRTFRIPFDDVWYAALLVAGSVPGWKIVRADDRDGRIIAESGSRVLGFRDVIVHVWLDPNAVTRVDVRSASRRGFADFGANARRVQQFYAALDEQLLRWGKEQALPAQAR